MRNGNSGGRVRAESPVAGRGAPASVSAWDRAGMLLTVLLATSLAAAAAYYQIKPRIQRCARNFKLHHAQTKLRTSGYLR
eukprot:365325-Chlamydomonas_euryale.AAC.3